MGCTVISRLAKVEPQRKDTFRKTPFPLSYYQKCLLKNSWALVRLDPVGFGAGLFHRLLTAHPDVQMLFPEFSKLNSINELQMWTKLEGHPLRFYKAFDEAMNALDDGDVFISKMEKLGSRHNDSILDQEILNAVGAALLNTLADALGKEEWTRDVECAWKDLYVFICKAMKIGLNEKKRTKSK